VEDLLSSTQVQGYALLPCLIARSRAAVGCARRQGVAATNFAQVGQGHPCDTVESRAVWEEVAIPFEVTVIQDATATARGDQIHATQQLKLTKPALVACGRRIGFGAALQLNPVFA
jgi:hypothetical protein